MLQRMTYSTCRPPTNLLSNSVAGGLVIQDSCLSLTGRLTEMPNTNMVVTALLAYVTAVLQEKDTSNRVIRTVADALRQDVLLGIVGMP